MQHIYGENCFIWVSFIRQVTKALFIIWYQYVVYLKRIFKKLSLLMSYHLSFCHVSVSFHFAISMFGSSRQVVPCEKNSSENVAKFAGKHLPRILLGTYERQFQQVRFKDVLFVVKLVTSSLFELDLKFPIKCNSNTLNAILIVCKSILLVFENSSC